MFNIQITKYQRKTKPVRFNKSTYHLKFNLTYLNELIVDPNNVILIKS